MTSIYDKVKPGDLITSDLFNQITATIKEIDDKTSVIEIKKNSEADNSKPSDLSVKSNLGIGTKESPSELEVNGTVKTKNNGQFLLLKGLKCSKKDEGSKESSMNLDFMTSSEDRDTQFIPTASLRAIDDKNSSSHLAFFTKELVQDQNSLTERLRITSDGKIGIGTNNPSDKLEVNGNIKAKANLFIVGKIGIGTSTPQTKLDVQGDISINDTDLWLRSGADKNHGIGWYGGSSKLFANTGPDGPVVFGYSGGALGTTDNGQKIALQWYSNGNVIIGTEIGTENPSSKLTVAGSIAGGETATGWVLGRGASGPDNWLRLTTKQNENKYHDFAIEKLWAAGKQQFDLAEVTPVKSEDQLKPGDVVVIDEENGLRVKRSTKAYDTSVYGIVSSYESAAMVIGGAGPEVVTNESGKLPIALIGRVTAKVSAEGGLIQVGDLLTTSPTAGHLMKCSDISKGIGAVAGKALESFSGSSSNTGTITVLVTLQ